MKRPVFSQLDRLADYGEDEGRDWSITRRRRITEHRKSSRIELDELIRDDGRVVDRREDDDAE